MDPLIITCAPVGAEVRLEQTPHLPHTPRLLGETARAVQDAGGSILHVHCRNDDGTNTHSVERFCEAYDAIRAESDLIVQFSTGGAIGMTLEERSSVLQLRPEMATLTCGSVNFGDDIFENRYSIRGTFPTRAGSQGKDSSRFRSTLTWCLVFPAAWMQRCRTCAIWSTISPRGARGRSPGSDASSCRWPWPPSQWAATSEWVWKTTCTIAAGGWHAMRSSWRASRGLRWRQDGRSLLPIRPGRSSGYPCPLRGARAFPSNNGAHSCSHMSCAGRFNRFRCCLRSRSSSTAFSTTCRADRSRPICRIRT